MNKEADFIRKIKEKCNICNGIGMYLMKKDNPKVTFPLVVTVGNEILGYSDSLFENGKFIFKNCDCECNFDDFCNDFEKI